jgi:hypothetical protein
MQTQFANTFASAIKGAEAARKELNTITTGRASIVDFKFNFPKIDVSWLASVFDDVVESWTPTDTIAKNVLNTLLQYKPVQAILQGIADGGIALANSVKKVWDETAGTRNAIATTFNAIMSFLGEFSTKTDDTSKEAVSSLRNIIIPLDTIKAALSSIMSLFDGVGSSFNGMKNGLNSIFELIKTVFPVMGKTTNEWLAGTNKQIEIMNVKAAHQMELLPLMAGHAIQVYADAMQNAAIASMRIRKLLLQRI